MEIVTLLFILLAGSVISLPLIKLKYAKVIPRALVLIIIGILLAGSNDISGGGPLWSMPGWINPKSPQNAEFFGTISIISVGVLMYFAGFGLNTRQLVRMGPAPILMGIVPCIFEGFVVGALLLLVLPPHINWAFAFAGGFAVAASTPGIIIPMIMKIKGKGYSKKSGINDVIIVGTTLDTITAISLFIVFFKLGLPSLGAAATPDPLWEILIFQTPWLFIHSAIWGIAIGMALWGVKLLQDKLIVKDKIKLHEKFIINIYSLMFFFITLLTSAGIFYVADGMKQFASPYAHFEFLLAIMVAGLTVSHMWKSPRIATNKEETEKAKSFGRSLGLFWTYIGMTIVFINTGTSISFSIFISTDIFIAFWFIVFGLMARQAGVIAATYSKSFTWKERLFGGIGYIPKGTSTAGAVAYMQVMADSEGVVLPPDLYIWVLLIASVAIITTIPISELLINYCAPRLLEAPEEEVKKEKQLKVKPPKTKVRPFKEKKTTTNLKK